MKGDETDLSVDATMSVDDVNIQLTRSGPVLTEPSNAMNACEGNTSNEVPLFDPSESSLTAHSRSKRFIFGIAMKPILGFLAKTLFGVLFKVGVDAVLEDPHRRQTKENFQKMFDAIDRNYDAITQNYKAIMNMDRKIENTFVLLTGVFSMVTQTQLTIEAMRAEMQEGFNRVLESIRDLRVSPIVSRLNNFIQYFLSEREMINTLSHSEYIAKMQEQDNILHYLKDSRTPKGDSLRTPLLEIMQHDLAIPLHGNDDTAFSALYALYYGTQTYVSVMLFLLEHYTRLADYCYQDGDLEGYNKFINSIEIHYKAFSLSLVGRSGDISLIDNVIGILRTVRDKAFIEDVGENSSSDLSERIRLLSQTKLQLEKMNLPVIFDIPAKIPGKPMFPKKRVSTPMGDWKDGAKVRYAVQYRTNGTYSRVGKWSEPLTVRGNANPIVRIPVDQKRRDRLVFRQFDSERPQLVGVVENAYETEFRDINRDLFNAASNFDVDIGVREVEILIRNGADINAVFDNGRVAIHAAAQSDNVQLIREFLIRNNPSGLNVKDNNGYTPMHIAAEAGHDSFIQLLIESGADVNAETYADGFTPLHIAVTMGYQTTVSTLLKNDAINVNARDVRGFTPLHNAVFGGDLVVRTLLSHNSSDVNAKSDAGLTPLHLSSISNFVDIAESLLESGETDVNAGTEAKMSALHFASMIGHLEMVKMLTASTGINVNADSVYGCTPLHLAVSLEKEEVALELMKCKDIDVNVAGDGNVTPLHIAAMLGEVSVLSGLLPMVDSAEVQTKDGSTALHFAAEHGHLDAISALIDHGADVNTETCKGSTPLQLAVASPNSNLDSVKYLMAKGGGSGKVPDLHGNLLHLSARSGNVDVVEYVLGKGFNIDARDSHGNCPLHIAAENGHFNIVKYLIEKGANRSVTGINGQSLLHYASSSGRLDLVRFVAQGVSDVNVKDGDGSPPLHTAAKLNYVDVVKYLVEEKSADINIKNSNGKTVLHLATSSGFLDLTKYLIKIGAGLYAKDTNGLAPLVFAAENGHLDIVRYLTEKVNVSVLCNAVASPLAARNGHLDVVKHLMSMEIQSLAAVNGRASIFSAALHGHIDVVEYLSDRLLDSASNREYIKYYYAMIEKTKPQTEFGDIPIVLTLSILSLTLFEVRNDLLVTLSLYAAAIFSEKGLWSVKHVLDELQTDVSPIMYEGTTLLHFAAAFGNLDVVQYLAEEKHSDVNAQNDRGMSPLLIAVQHNHLNIVQYLVGRGASLNSKESRSPLLFAAANGNLNMLEYLLEKGCDVNSSSRSFREKRYILPVKDFNLRSIENGTAIVEEYYESTSLSNAARYGHLNIVKYLTENGADVNAEFENNHTPLHVAAEKGHLDVVKYLVDGCHAKVNVRNKESLTPLYYAAKTGNLEMVKYLTENGADVNAESENNDTPLHVAAEKGHLDVVKYLVDGCHAKVNVRNKRSLTPIFYAVLSGNLEIVTYLEERHSNTNFEGRVSLLDNAVKMGHFDMVKYLIERGVKIGRELLHKAATRGDFEIVMYLIKNGASVRARTAQVWFLSYDKTPLHCAAENGHLKVVKYLTAERADVNAKDSYRWTPLHYASRYGHLEVVEYLIGDKGADANVLGTDNATPLHCAMSRGHYRVALYIIRRIRPTCEPLHVCLAGAIYSGSWSEVSYFVRKGADINLESFGETPLQRAVSLGYFSIVKHLIEQGANINEKLSSNGLTPLQFAAQNGDLPIVQHLVEKGADVEAETEFGSTSLDIAKWFCDAAVADFLESKSVNRNRRSVTLGGLSQKASVSAHGVREGSAASSNHASSGTSKLSSWVNTIAVAAVNTAWRISRFVLSPFKPAIETEWSAPPKATADADIQGALFLLNVLVRKVSGQRFVSSANRTLSSVEAMSYALNVTDRFEAAVKQAAVGSGISLHRLNVDFGEVLSSITRKVMGGNFSEIPGVLSSSLQTACPGRESGCPGRLSKKKHRTFTLNVNKELETTLNESVLEILHCINGSTLGETNRQHVSTQPKGYLKNTSVRGQIAGSCKVQEIS